MHNRSLLLYTYNTLSMRLNFISKIDTNNKNLILNILYHKMIEKEYSNKTKIP